MKKLTIEHIKNQLESLGSLNPKLKDIIIHRGEASPKIALAVRESKGTIKTITDFLTLGEMQQFLRGYMFKNEGRLNHKPVKKKYYLVSVGGYSDKTPLVLMEDREQARNLLRRAIKSGSEYCGSVESVEIVTETDALFSPRAANDWSRPECIEELKDCYEGRECDYFDSPED
tara:strand:+ start:48287 stop:48805 length:519 start_codon:yes stop_codon:yes gene_type:complete